MIWIKLLKNPFVDFFALSSRWIRQKISDFDGFSYSVSFEENKCNDVKNIFIRNYFWCPKLFLWLSRKYLPTPHQSCAARARRSQHWAVSARIRNSLNTEGAEFGNYILLPRLNKHEVKRPHFSEAEWKFHKLIQII